MKKQIEELQNYFINKITACDFELVEIECAHSNWADMRIKVDGEYIFNVCLNSFIDMIVCYGFMEVQIPFSRTKNLIEYVNAKKETARQQHIEKLQQQIKELQA